jgi:hypothetical protein
MNEDDFLKIAFRDIRASYRDAFNEWVCNDRGNIIKFLKQANQRTKTLIEYLEEKDGLERSEG